MSVQHFHNETCDKYSSEYPEMQTFCCGFVGLLYWLSGSARQDLHQPVNSRNVLKIVSNYAFRSSGAPRCAKLVTLTVGSAFLRQFW